MHLLRSAFVFHSLRYWRHFLKLCVSVSSSPEMTNDVVRDKNVMVTNTGHILGIPQFGLRDNLIKVELLKQEGKYTYIHNYRLVYSFCGLCNQH